MSALNWKRRIGGVWSLLNSSLPRTVCITYHAVGETGLGTPPDQFRKQCEWIAANADVVSPTKIAEISTGAFLPKRLTVCITFDDGYGSVYDNAYPALCEFGLTAAVYLNSGWILKSGRRPADECLGHYPDEEYMNWREVNKLLDSGWTIGGHGVDHLDLTKLSPVDIQKQVYECRMEIEEHTSQVCCDFAYTWGRHNSIVRDEIMKAGYKTAMAGVHGPVRQGVDVFAIPRADIRREYLVEDVASIVAGDWDYLKLLQKVRGV